MLKFVTIVLQVSGLMAATRQQFYDYSFWSANNFLRAHLPGLSCKPVGECETIYGSETIHFAQFGFVKPDEFHCHSTLGLTICVDKPKPYPSIPTTTTRSTTTITTTTTRTTTTTLRTPIRPITITTTARPTITTTRPTTTTTRPTTTTTRPTTSTTRPTTTTTRPTTTTTRPTTTTTRPTTSTTRPTTTTTRPTTTTTISMTTSAYSVTTPVAFEPALSTPSSVPSGYYSNVQIIGPKPIYVIVNNVQGPSVHHQYGKPRMINNKRQYEVESSKTFDGTVESTKKFQTEVGNKDERRDLLDSAAQLIRLQE